MLNNLALLLDPVFAFDLPVDPFGAVGEAFPVRLDLCDIATVPVEPLEESADCVATGATMNNVARKLAAMRAVSGVKIGDGENLIASL